MSPFGQPLFRDEASVAGNAAVATACRRTDRCRRWRSCCRNPDDVLLVLLTDGDEGIFRQPQNRTVDDDPQIVELVDGTAELLDHPRDELLAGPVDRAVAPGEDQLDPLDDIAHPERFWPAEIVHWL